MKITIIDYVKNKMIHKQATFYYRNGKGMYIWEGKEYTPQEFKKAFPIFGKLISCKDQKKTKENPNKQKNYYYNEKSY